MLEQCFLLCTVDYYFEVVLVSSALGTWCKLDYLGLCQSK